MVEVRLTREGAWWRMQVTTLQEQAKGLKHELSELKAQLKTLSSKSLTREQASKEAIARAEKHAREMSRLRLGLCLLTLHVCASVSSVCMSPTRLRVSVFLRLC